jgi:hypothetical protein
MARASNDSVPPPVLPNSNVIRDSSISQVVHPDSVAVKRPLKPFTAMGTAPAGATIYLDADSTIADSTGRWSLTVPLDSLTRFSGALDLCLFKSGQKACVPLRAAGNDTLELAPLRFTETQVVAETTLVVTPPATDDSTSLMPSSNAVMLDGGRTSKKRTVVVKGTRRQKVLGQEVITVQQIKRLPGLGEPDVIRAVQALPGVVSTSDFSTKIYVRGSSSDQNLVLFDNAVVYSPSHFGGLFSTFLADATGGLDFYKGGFDPRYGNRLASVLLVKSKDGGSTYDTATSRLSGTKIGDSAKVSGSLRLTTLSGTAETDGQKGNWSWTMAGRRTWIDQALSLADAVNLTDFKLGYYFYDAQGNVAWGNKYDTVRVSLYQGRDVLDIGALHVDWGNVAVPLNVHKRLKPDLYYDAALAWSGFDQVLGVQDFIEFKNNIGTLNTRHELKYTGLLGHAITSGYEFNNFRVRFSLNNKARGEYSEDRYTVNLHSGFLQDRWVINPRHTITAGFRGYYYAPLVPKNESFGLAVDHYDQYVQPDPRLSYTYYPTKNWRYDLHVGRYHQFLTSLRFDDQETINEFWYAAKGPMKPSSSTVVSGGIERAKLSRFGLTASLQGYYKDIESLPLFNPDDITADSAGSRKVDFSKYFGRLDGYAMGGDVSLKREEGAVSGDVSYGLSMAVLKQISATPGSASQVFKPYLADWDQQHTFKLTGLLNWRGDNASSLWTHPKRGRYFRSSLQWNFHTGLPYTDLGLHSRTHEGFDGASGLPGVTPAIRSEANDRNSTNRPYYSRLDITPFDVGRAGKWRFYWSIVNILNSENVYSVSIDTHKNPPEKSYNYQLPILPIFLGYEYEF